MRIYNYIIASFIVCMLFLSSCSTFGNGPKMMIEFEIEEADLSMSQKKEAITKIKNRLMSVGLTNVTVVEEKQQKVTLTFQGTIKPKALKRNFVVAGKLEFFEVVTERNLVLHHLFQNYESDSESELESEVTAKVSENKDFTEFKETVRLIHNDVGDGTIGFVKQEDRERLEKSTIYKTPFLVKGLNKKVKFLLGKSYNENEYALYVVYITSTGEAALDGNCIVDASVGNEYASGRYVVNLKMNKEGAITWERLTEKVHNERGFIAVTIDDFIYSAPSVRNGKISGGMTEISGGFTKETAEEMAIAIGSGTIPKVKITKVMIVE